MRKSKNNSSICQTTTLLSLSNVSIDQQESTLSQNKQHNILIQKIHELKDILEVTNTQQILLKNRYLELTEQFEAKKCIIKELNRPAFETRNQKLAQDDFNESQSNDQTETYRNNMWTKSKQFYKGHRLQKNHKYYSAIQSPALTYSPQRIYDGFTVNYYHKHHYFNPKSTFSTTTGTIRKQRDKIPAKMELYKCLSPNRSNYKSIQDIWNQKQGDSKKLIKHKSIKSFL